MYVKNTRVPLFMLYIYILQHTVHRYLQTSTVWSQEIHSQINHLSMLKTQESHCLCYIYIATYVTQISSNKHSVEPGNTQSGKSSMYVKNTSPIVYAIYIYIATHSTQISSNKHSVEPGNTQSGKSSKYVKNTRVPLFMLYIYCNIRYTDIFKQAQCGARKYTVR